MWTKEAVVRRPSAGVTSDVRISGNEQVEPVICSFPEILTSAAPREARHDRCTVHRVLIRVPPCDPWPRLYLCVSVFICGRCAFTPVVRGRPADAKRRHTIVTSDSRPSSGVVRFTRSGEIG